MHSVFHSALNCRVGNQLVAVLSAGSPLHPYSVVAAQPVDFIATGLVTGMAVILQNGSIQLGGATGGLLVQLHKAQVVDCSVQAVKSWQPPAWAQEKRKVIASVVAGCTGAEQGLAPVLAALLPQNAPSAGMELNQWCEFLLPRLQVLPELIQTATPDVAAAAAKQMAGCGPGLTPSSDDFITGLLAALWGARLAGCWQRQDGESWCRAFATAAAAATGDISAGYLLNAGQGLFSEDILALLSFYFQPADDTALLQQTAPPQLLAQLQALAVKISQFGSCSGSDILSGIWYGLSVADKGKN